jgi:hypothetical protein
MKSGYSKLRELADIIENANYFPKNIRLFLITDESYISIFGRKISTTYSLDADVFHVTYLRCDRGLILDIFSKIEFFLNEIIILTVLGFKMEDGVYDKNILLGDILDNVDLFSKVRMLNKWKILNNDLLNLFMQIRQVRNGFAHVWDKDEILYRGIKIKNNFNKFKEDVSKVCFQLLEIYKSLQDKIDFDALTNIFKNFQLHKEKEAE